MPSTTVKLFRLGNRDTPRMDKVRPGKDVQVYDSGGVPWVRAGTGGVSTSEVPGRLSGTWWSLDGGYDYGSVLLVWNDHDRHWSWEPESDMPLADFVAALLATHPSFARV